MKKTTTKILLILIVPFVVLVVSVVLFTNKNNSIPHNSNVENKELPLAVKPVLKEAMLSIVKSYENTSVRPGFMVLFQANDSSIYFINSPLYFEEGLMGFEIVKGYYFSFYGESGSETFIQRFINFDNLSIAELNCCSYESHVHFYVTAFDEEYLKFRYTNENLVLVDQGRVESLPIQENVPTHEIILKIKERLFVPPPP